jgi:hypothetical protein
MESLVFSDFALHFFSSSEGQLQRAAKSFNAYDAFHNVMLLMHEIDIVG